MAKWEKRLAKEEKERQERAAAELRKPARPVPKPPPLVDPRRVTIQHEAQAFAEQMAKELDYKPSKVSAVVFQSFGAVDFSFEGFSSEPTVTFEFLEGFSVRYGTKKIDMPSHSQDSSGCDTCGHGSEWSFSLRVRDAFAPF